MLSRAKEPAANSKDGTLIRRSLKKILAWLRASWNRAWNPTDEEWESGQW
jgi:hypothetical protein